MSSFVFMRVLESAPSRYDWGMQILSQGRISQIYERIGSIVAGPGQRVLDVGCGTGGVTLACAAQGADVTGIDVNAGMLEVAQSKAQGAGLVDRISWFHMSAVEIEDHFPEASFHAVVLCLILSELFPHEQHYLLKVIKSRLKPGGKLVVADENWVRDGGSHLWYRLKRFPLAIITYLIAQTSTRPLHDAESLVAGEGYTILESLRPWQDDFILLVAQEGDGRDET